jgi:S-adenosyl methyltransferase
VTMDEFADLAQDRPSAARMYDYWLGGYHNFEIDRQTAEQLMAAMSGIRESAIANRLFLRRAVAFMAEQGVDQFLDLGSGLPTVGNVHEVARGINPEARVVYVDIDPVAVALSERIVAGDQRIAVVQADVRDYQALLLHPAVRAQIDFSRPLGVLLVALVHFIIDDAHAREVIGAYHAVAAQGSYLAFSHGTADFVTPEEQARAKAIQNRSSSPGRFRSHAEALALLDGWSLLPPGLVVVNQWRPDPDAAMVEPQVSFYAAVGQK